MLIHDDDEFRKALIKSLDRKHFTVTFSPDGDDAVRLLRERRFRVIVLGVDVAEGKGLASLAHLRANRGTPVIIIGDPNPDLRNHARDADETLLKPVDPDYVAERARPTAPERALPRGWRSALPSGPL
jgi:DNA-binding response OmpR family regulator